MLLFALDADKTLANALAADLDEMLASHEDRAFADGEHKLRPLVDPRGDDCYVLASLHGDALASPQDKLVALLSFAATLRDHDARRVTALVPYLAYARKDRRTKPFDPVTLRYVAQWCEASGVDRLVVLEAHNPAALDNAFRCPVVHLPAHPLFEAPATAGPLVVVSPDIGGAKRAQLWREHLQARLGREIGFALVDKRRSAGVVSGGHLVAGDVAGATALLLDDLVASGETLLRAAQALRRAGAREVLAHAAHGLFIPPAAELLADAAIARLVVTDSVPPQRLPADGPVARKLQVVSAARLFAQAVRACHDAWQG
ncbi:ribose-phosphate diphosphokinase [Rubrivivax sp. RP6-9]|uniref:ribose-phosphate diphosphokinase n=1 Tax=Rubrivivax sp. RP6-9 TaxID=3415750 RepID=UPI003CC69403